MAGTVTRLMVALLRERARDGVVAISDVEKIADLVTNGTAMSLDQAFRAHEEKCQIHHLKSAPPASAKGNVGARSNPFQRLIVRPFEQMLQGSPPPFPRKYLTTYFHAVRVVLGEESFTYFEKQCKAVIQGLLVVHGTGLGWDTFYADPRTVEVLANALASMRTALRTPKGWQEWSDAMAAALDDGSVLSTEQILEVHALLISTADGLAMGRGS